MKFEDLLMQPSEERQRKRDLEEEVEILQQELNGELQLKGVLQCALQGPSYSCPCIPRMSSLLPHKVQMLLAEIAAVEEEIMGLERKVDELKLNVYREKQQNKEWSKDLPPQAGQRHQKRLLCRLEHHIEAKDCKKLSISQNSDQERRKRRILKERRASLGSSMDFQSMHLPRSNEELGENSSSSSRRHYTPFDIEIDFEKPNRLSEELMTCLIGIFLRLNQEAAASKTKGSAIVPKDGSSYMNSKGFISKNSSGSAAPALSFEGKTTNAEPYGILSDIDGTIRDVGSYKNFIEITRNTLDTSRLTAFHPEMRKLRVLVHELSNVDLTYLSYKQKLAFWINIYNACIMQALLQHGPPPTKEKLLGLMKEATVNVGGLVLNALSIERYILRLPSDSKHKRRTDHEKEMILRHAYGLGYPEPSITFALCRGTWSSPALRIYRPDQVVNDLERAKVEYLEASVGVTSKKKILLPKILQWHMRDFAYDMESLVEWIYSQLPRSASLKRLIMECLNGETKSPLAKLIEVQPYAFDFRYLLPV